ncbi:TetR/AcrR family transcriptional regulator [Listeria grandensis]|uniref:TetR/AcrR family transcriptional regulator n=2 Tax=Listeria grandensis TaxID=1494963 RepID=A0A7X1CPG3_9LIST|nr:TetR/AcrR family transcriptional regulator [Listeria grandensis]MBC1474435.1 TetR/AcrR family transcriptional regulator [Listeria grandensis]MBC1935980.1 TetR/AcrR family transcriptional regulator [Listeria grandensis]
MKNSDLRVQKTKKALYATLLKMLEKEELSSITVNDICKEALVHRTTFYKHFYDKYDLLMYVLHEQFQDYFALDIKDRINHPFQSGFDTVYMDMQLALEKQKNDDTFFKTMASFFLTEFQKDIEANIDKLTVASDIPPDLLTYIYAANLGAIMYWSQQMTEPADWAQMDTLFKAVLPVKIDL